MQNFIQIAMMLVPILTDLIRSAEQTIKGAKKGELKKKAVMDALKGVLNGISMFKQGTKNYQNMVLMIASQLIDGIVFGLNISGMWGRKVEVDLPPGEYEIPG